MTRAHLNLLAFVCSLCPICIARRQWPGSLFGRVTARIERGCPFCTAYRTLHGQSPIEDRRPSCGSKK